MRRFITVLSVAVAGSLALAASATGAAELDQQQTTLDQSRVLAIGGDGPQVLAQVVVNGIPGLLAQVDLPLSCAPSSALTVQIRESTATPSGVAVASQTVTDVPSGTAAWRSIVFSRPVFMPADWPFAIVLSSPGFCGTLGSGLGVDAYPRGDGLYQGPPNPPGVWSPAGEDLGFKTFVERICQVPTLLTSMTLTEARATLVRYGCSLGKVTSRYSLDYPRGAVMAMEQTVGTRLAAGAAVNVVVSLGKPPCKVPRVKGKTLRKARAAIVRANCRVGAIRTAPSTKALRGRVIAQRPTAGTRRPYKARVKLVVGRGGR